MAIWSGKDLQNNQEDADRDSEPLRALKNWQYVYQLLEDNIVNSTSVFKNYLALRNMSKLPVFLRQCKYTVSRFDFEQFVLNIRK